MMQVVGALAALFAVALALGGAFGVARARSLKTSFELLVLDNGNMREQMVNDRHDCERSIAHLEGQVEALSSELVSRLIERSTDGLKQEIKEALVEAIEEARRTWPPSPTRLTPKET